MWNGRGYPRGLKGEHIHIFGRIIGLVDVFDALICRRCCKETWLPEKVRALIESERGEHFDLTITDLAVTYFDELMQIHVRHPGA
jgi:response regulator RpfG family c-di-GMP phosphodiesterase